ncbi:MAG: SDR family oxidoreductase [Gammaproteobacteria bacterium]|nr:SDR family oxidoreductase [Gammaproteobacteria bacterium]
MTKNVFITGANRGIGLELTRQYLVAGEKVFASARDPSTEGLSRLTERYPDNLKIVMLDVTDESNIQNVAGSLEGTSIDLLINNAGLFHSKHEDFSSLNPDIWIEEFRVNSIAPFLVTRALKSNLANANSSVVGMISSKMGSMGDNQSGGSYSYRSSKAALNAVSVSLANDLSDLDISVVALHPGWVQTDMGGPNGLIDVETSATGLKAILDKAGKAQSGKFYDYSGKQLPW